MNDPMEPRPHARPRKRRRVVRGLLAAAVIAASTACEDATEPGANGKDDECRSEVAEVLFDVDEPLTLVRVYGAEWVRPAFENSCGEAVTVSSDDVAWTSADTGVASVRAFEFSAEPTAFLQARSFGETTITAAVDDVAGELDVAVTRPPTEASAFTVVDSGYVGPYTTDLWVHGDHAYSGSQPWSCPDPCEDQVGWLYVWRVDADGGLTRIDSMSLPAAKINDVKVSADGRFAVASQERGGPAENGIVVLDLADPAAPAVAAIHTDGLEHGVHNTWIETIDGRDYVFVVESGSAAEGGVHVVDVTDRAAPTEVALFHAGSSFPHDVYVRDGLAFVSHWNAGLVILDVGHGMADGAPDDPVEVSRVETAGGHAHNAWYWPDGGVVFVGEERFPPPDRIDEVGVLHVVDVSDMAAPTEVATYGVPGSSPHNFWLDEARGILFAAWYTNGLRAIDVTGTLAGDLGDQDRELGHVLPSGHRGAGSIWAPQLHDGVIYLSDIYNGLWAVRYDG